MAALEKTVSALVNRQLPDFVRADHPQFKRFLELYYKWLEDETKGNTVYHIMRSGEYRDVDSTLDPFIRLFKQELLPYFPERSELDLVKILKGAREFYVKKGSEESVKWLFRVLFGQDIEVYYPKQQILIASDGKWKLPQAFQLTLSAENANIDVNLLEKRLATGSISKATCTIESANKTIDRTFGNEVLELYVSNVTKNFTNGEDLEIWYVDENGVEKLFAEKIIGSISNIYVDSNVRTDPQQKRRGLLYNVGDPVVVFGGLADTADANDAVAIVGNVTVGSIEGLNVLFPGYGYRTYSNTEAIVYRTPSDDPAANQSTDIRVSGINTFDSANSQAKFLEEISVDLMPIDYMNTVVISDTNYSVLTSCTRNIVIVVSGEASDTWQTDDLCYANSNGSYQTANFTAQVLTANTGFTGAPKSIVLYNVANTVPLTTTGFLVGANTLTFVNASKVVNVDSITTTSLPANVDSTIKQSFAFQTLQTGGVALYNIINGGYGFRGTPSILTTSYYDTYLSNNYVYGTADHRTWRQPLNAFGKIAHVWINNGGSGYANGDAIVIGGRGYGFTGYVTVGANGTIVSTTITNRGEGYYEGDRPVTVTTSGGVGAALTAYGFGEGVSVGVETGAIGRVRDVRMISRGFDYIDTPLVSFKVVDMVIDGILESESLSEGERVYQGATLETATFQGIIKNYNRSTKMLRLFNYSGGYASGTPLISEGGVEFNVDTLARVPAPNHTDPTIRASGLPNPMFYGNGKAKGYAEFFQGLIKFNGFYLNTDGFLSSDKKLQDMNVYHNYSYVIESEKSLSDYENTMKDIVHPIGMSMLARTISRSDLDEDIKAETIVSSYGIQPVGSLINVQNSFANTVNGVNTEWANTYYANVGDLLVLKDSDNPLRGQVKVIQVIQNNTTIKVEGDFTYLGQGVMRTNAGNSVVYMSGNTNAISDFLQVDDELRFNIYPSNTFSAGAFGTVDVVGGSTLVTGNTGTAFGTNILVGHEVQVNNEVRLVVNIASASVMNVNAAFTYSANGASIGRRLGSGTRKVTGISGNVVTLNTTVSGTCTINYRVIPDYKTTNYDYDIIRVTE